MIHYCPLCNNELARKGFCAICQKSVEGQTRTEVLRNCEGYQLGSSERNFVAEDYNVFPDAQTE